jgi:chemotaxis protein histidine kinase CheA
MLSSASSSPFSRRRKWGRGTGLGLPTVHGIIKQSGTDIRVSSDLDRGSTFSISLPLVSEKDIAIAPDKEEGARGSETILFVEDEKQVRDVVEQVLARLGYHVLSRREASSC